MATASGILIKEHTNVKRLIKVLQKATAMLEEGRRVDPQIFIKSGSFITHYLEQKHHAKEEKIFYSLLGKYGFSKDEPPLADFLSEHDQARSHTRALREAAFRLEQGNTEAKSDVINEAHAYIRLLDHHITNEDNNLFPLADCKFDEQTQKELIKRFDK